MAIRLARLRRRSVFFYTYDIPRPVGNGFRIRNFTNVRVYRDLGFDVEVVVFLPGSVPDPANEVVQTLGARLTIVQSHESTSSVFDRLMYKLGNPNSSILNVLYPGHWQVQREVLQREITSPGAIHHFESIGIASAAYGFRKLNAVYSSHDIAADRYLKVVEMRRVIGRRLDERTKALKAKRLWQAERAVAQSCKLVLAIAQHELEVYRTRWGFPHLHLLPMSWPDEEQLPRKRGWGEGGKLRLLHIGSTDAFIGFYSLKFILGDVFPLLPPAVIERIELLVVGKNQDTPYSKSIQSLAAPYPQVRFLGFVDDIRSLYSMVDLQVVGAQLATGLRTRILESFVFGVPVLSTDIAALGLVGLAEGKNILMAKDAAGFAAHIQRILESPSILLQLAANARETYDQYYSRSVQSQTLAVLLDMFLTEEPPHAARR